MFTKNNSMTRLYFRNSSTKNIVTRGGGNYLDLVCLGSLNMLTSFNVRNAYGGLIINFKENICIKFFT
jgi:hypothetical protein